MRTERYPRMRHWIRSSGSLSKSIDFMKYFSIERKHWQTIRIFFRENPLLFTVRRGTIRIPDYGG